MGLNVTHSKLLDRLNYESKVKTMKGWKVMVHSLARNILGVERYAKTPRWGLKWMTSESIIHIDLHKPHNKLSNA
jgi:hypothetical protein